MSNETKDDEPARVEQPTPAARRSPTSVPRSAPPTPPAAISSPARVVFLDYQPEETPSFRTAPLTLSHGANSLPLQPGINPVEQEQWASFETHPAALLLIASEDLVVLPELPRRKILELVKRTWGHAGLDALEQAEKAIYGDKPREAVVAALVAQRARIQKTRAKPAAPAAPEPVSRRRR